MKKEQDNFGLTLGIGLLVIIGFAGGLIIGFNDGQNKEPIVPHRVVDGVLISNNQEVGEVYCNKSFPNCMQETNAIYYTNRKAEENQSPALQEVQKKIVSKAITSSTPNLCNSEYDDLDWEYFPDKNIKGYFFVEGRERVYTICPYQESQPFLDCSVQNNLLMAFYKAEVKCSADANCSKYYDFNSINKAFDIDKVLKEVD